MVALGDISAISQSILLPQVQFQASSRGWRYLPRNLAYAATSTDCTYVCFLKTRLDWGVSTRRTVSASRQQRGGTWEINASVIPESIPTSATVNSTGEGVETEPDTTGSGGDFGSVDGGGESGGGGNNWGNNNEGEGDSDKSEDSNKKMAMSMSQKLTLGYAALVGLGGVMGYVKSGSQKSLVSGGLSALILFYVYTQLPTNPVAKSGNAGKASLGSHSQRRSSLGKETSENGKSDGKAKLKPFFWDKVLANPDHSMVWHEIKAGSFQFDEEMMENLFGYTNVEKKKNDHKKDPSTFEAPKYIQIIEPKKAQNLAILLKALNVTTEEVCEAIMEGNELPAEFIQTLLKMALTTEEELKLRLYSGDLSQLGPAERFLKAMVDIPFAFKRLESLLFMCSLQEEVSSIKESLSSIEVACNELKSSRLFLKLLEAVLKTGNRMNDGTFRGDAQAFKLDTLLKLSDVKGTDGKTTLLHFVVLEIIRSEGIRAARRARESHSITTVKTEDLVDESTQETEEYLLSLGLQVVFNLSDELENVRKAALVDGDMLTANVLKLGNSLKNSKEFMNNEMGSLGEESEFHDTLASFVQQAEDDIVWLLEEEKKIMTMVKSTADYFHGTAGKDEGLRLFMVVRDFLKMVEKVCNEVKKKAAANPTKTTKKEVPSASPSQESRQPTSPSVEQRLFPAIKEQRIDDSSSDDESSSP